MCWAGMAARAISKMSRKPSLVMIPTDAPRRCRIALRPRVVPWANTDTRSSRELRPPTASMTPRAGAAGVVGALCNSSVPVLSS